MVEKYIPSQGDIVYVNLNPIIGHEQKGRRPAVVLSKKIFNIHTNMIIVSPISSNTKEFPTHYLLKETKKIKGSVLCEHIRSIDYTSRNVSFVERTSEMDLLSIVTLTNACIE